MTSVHWHRDFNWSDIGPGVLASGAEAHLYRIGPTTPTKLPRSSCT